MDINQSSVMSSQGLAVPEKVCAFIRDAIEARADTIAHELESVAVRAT